ncbi:unannotated protein [freshwater metagenome]|uniref:Unannotated protein n=1 Tax=freshwater metagenome TaxID=449393 RepID=A0A6J6UKT3_9ZZZZ
MSARNASISPARLVVGSFLRRRALLERSGGQVRRTRDALEDVEAVAHDGAAVRDAVDHRDAVMVAHAAVAGVHVDDR